MHQKLMTTLELINVANAHWDNPRIKLGGFNPLSLGGKM